MTNIAELVEYALLPHNDSVSKPRALNTFLGRITEIRVDNGLIKNKKVLSDLIEKKKATEICVQRICEPELEQWLDNESGRK